MAKTYLFIALLLGGWIESEVLAQPQQYKFSRIDIQNGLSNSQVKSVFKDSKGFMWFGTVSGLNRFDGYSIKVFQNDPNDSTTIHDSDVIRIFEDPKENIWIYTWTGLGYYSHDTEFFSRNTNALLKEFGVPSGGITDIKKDRAGNYWFLHATAGLFRYDPGSKTTRSISHSDTDSLSIITNQVYTLADDSNGDIWVVHRSGVFEKIDGKTFKVTYRNRDLKKLVWEESPDYSIMIDSDNDV